ncbi:MAG: dimethyl sulfoxide reductase anchor subunit [Slackia sp.]|nr:dimethyl sulfoxide reductase anchor subunit [Slackia sp.]
MQVNWPLVVSTVCQRSALGLFICAFVANAVLGAALPLSWIALVALVLIAVGGLASVFHLQRPQRFFNAFSNPKSHLTQEAVVTLPLGVLLLASCLNGIVYDLGEADVVVYAFTALAAMAFLIVTGMAYQMKSRPAWNTAYIPALFLLTAAEAGSIGVALACAVFAGGVSDAIVACALVFTVACICAQGAYLKRMAHVGYGVAVKISDAPYKGCFGVWVAFGAVIPLAGLCVAFAPCAVIAVAVAWVSSIIGIAVWTALFFRGALKVKMFPMYPVDLNLDM